MEYTQEEAYAIIGQMYWRIVKLEQIIAVQQRALDDRDGGPAYVDVPVNGNLK